jgi:hypothetical protein
MIIALDLSEDLTMSTHISKSETMRAGFIAMKQLSVEEHGKAMGELISLGDAYLFYTTNPELDALDGQRFASIAEARSAIRAHLKEQGLMKRYAGS